VSGTQNSKNYFVPKIDLSKVAYDADELISDEKKPSPEDSEGQSIDKQIELDQIEI